jgi:hypothetical protein
MELRNEKTRALTRNEVPPNPELVAEESLLT